MGNREPNIRKMRDLAGLKQGELARRAGMTQTRVCYIEGGFIGTTKERMRLIAVLERAIAERAEMLNEHVEQQRGGDIAVAEQ